MLFCNICMIFMLFEHYHGALHTSVFTLSAVGLFVVRTMVVDFPWLISLGLTPADFITSDYFPLLPNLGYFLVGAFLGRTLYRKKESLFPRQKSPCKLLSFIGRNSLIFYLLHQPVLAGAVYLWTVIF